MTLLTTRSRRRLAGVGCLALAVAFAVTARAQQQRTLGTPGANQLTIDFLAVTADGAPVTDLKAEDITIRISGKPRPVRALNLVKMNAAAAAPAAAPAAAAGTVPAPYSTNGTARNAAGRAFFIAVDNESIRPGSEAPVRDALNGFLSKLSSDDQVALVTIPHGGVNVDLTGDLAKVRAGVGQITGAGKANESVSDATGRSRNSLLQFTGILEALAGNDRPAVAILVSTSLIGAQTTGTANQTSATSGVGSLNGDLTSDDFSHIRAAAAAARAEVYTVQPPGAPQMDSASATVGRNSASRSASVDPQGGLQNIAGESGGQLFQLALSNETALDRIARETSSYYVATFDAEADDRNGTTHPITLKATRGDVTVRTRPDLWVAKASATGTKTVSVQDMLKTSDKFTSLAIRTQAYGSKMPAGAGDKDKIFVQAVTEPVEAGVKFSSASAGLYDSTGKLVTHDTADSPALAAMPLNSRMQVAPGKYRLRVAVTDAAGHSGAVDMPMDIGLTTGGPYQMGTMRLGTLQNNALKTGLQFSNEPEVVAFFELYGGAANQQLFLEFDVAKSVEGPAIMVLQPEPIPSGDRYVITGKIALKDLAAGDYVVRAKVGAVETQTGLITQTLRKVK